MTTQTSTSLNNTQLHLVKLFARPMSEQELKALKKVLIDFYDQLISDAIDLIWEERQLTQDNLDDLLNTHPKRTPNKKCLTIPEFEVILKK